MKDEKHPRVSAFTLHTLTLPFILYTLTLLCAPWRVRAQDNYEIQVYSYDTVEPGHTMVELHSNFTFEGRQTREGGVLPTEHAWHETVEITRGFTPWFETGFYIFTSARSGNGWDWVGDHIRPRFRVPESWHWPLGASISKRSDINGEFFLPTPGRGRFARLSTARSVPGISVSTRHSTVHGMGRE